MCGKAVKWRKASAGRVTSAPCVPAHLERSHAKLTSKVKKRKKRKKDSGFAPCFLFFFSSFFPLTSVQRMIKATKGTHKKI